MGLNGSVYLVVLCMGCVLEQVKCVTVIFRSLAVARKQQEEKLFLEQQQQAAKQAQDEASVASNSGGSSPQGATQATTADGDSTSSKCETAGPGQDEAKASDGDDAADAKEKIGKTNEGGEEGEEPVEEDEEEEAKPKLALAGADDFLPLFIWVVLQSKIPRLVSNAEYIHAYLNPKRLMGKSGYCLINLRSAIDFVTYVEASSLKIDPEYFATQVAAVEATLPPEEDA